MRLDMPEIETERLFLRPVEASDATDLFEVYSDPLVCKYLTFQPHKDVEVTLSGIKSYHLPYLKLGVPQTWVIEWKQNEKVIGLLNVHTVKEDVGEIGYVLHQGYWNQGIMVEALRELVQVAFTHIGIRRLEALYEKGNIASEKVLLACGFQIEGVLRQLITLSDGLYHDMVLAAILKDDERMITHGKNIRNKI